jgi:RNA polymerase sigma-70 factor (ECF subfamily)
MRATPLEMFERHHSAIYRYALRMTGAREAAEDVTQEVFLRVIRSRDRYDGRDRERAWLLRIARNLIIDLHRRHRRSPVDENSSDEASCGASQDLVLAVRQAIGRLDTDDRDVVLLRFIGGLGHDEIADVVGLSPAAVRSRIYRARVALRSMLARTAGQPRHLG